MYDLGRERLARVLSRTWPFGARVAVFLGGTMTRPFFFAVALLVAATLRAGDAGAAAEGDIAISEVAPPPPSSGVDQATLKTAAEGEIKRIDGARAPRWKGRRVLVSVALVKADDAPVSVTINATLREAKSGTMIAIVEGRARAEGSGSRELKKQVANAAVRSAVRQIPGALAQ
jgi:hypothetical protein